MTLEKLHRRDRARPHREDRDDELDDGIPGRETLTMRTRWYRVRRSGVDAPLPSAGARWASNVREVSEHAARSHGLVAFDPARGPHLPRLLRQVDEAGTIGPESAAAAAITEATSRPGAPLPDELRRRLERALGAELGEVRIHTDDSAAAAAVAVAARAFTLGRDIYFATGQYDPTSADGLRLIAHEVVHTVQHHAPGASGLEVSHPGEAVEREAEAVASRIAPALLASTTAAAERHPRARRAIGHAIGHAVGHAVGHAIEQPRVSDARTGRLLRDTHPAQPSTPSPGAPDADAQGERWTERSLRDLVRTGPPTRVIEQVAARDTENGLALLRSTRLWATVLVRHPRGRAVPAPTRQAMYSLVQRHLLDEDAYRQLFWARFDIRYERVYDQARLDRGDRSPPPASASWPWKPEIGERIWWQLDRLPPQDVSENRALEVFRSAHRADAAGLHFDDRPGRMETERNVAVVRETDTPSGDMHAAGDAVPRDFENTVRHEVGHAVHASLRGVVDPWLASTVRFTKEPANEANVRAFIETAAPFPDTVSEADRARFVRLVLAWVNKQRDWPMRGEGEDGRLLASLTSAHAGLNWRNAERAIPSLYLERDGHRVFPNLYYGTMNTAGPLMMEVVTTTGRDRAGYAPEEFFAECYAEYYVDPEAADDPSKRGGSLPAVIKAFFDQHVAARDGRGSSQR